MGAGRDGGTNGRGKGVTGRSAAGAADPGGEGHVNEVRLVGRLAADPAGRTLPSGDRIGTFRVVVRRRAEIGPVSVGGRARTVDTLECTAWTRRCNAS